MIVSVRKSARSPRALAPLTNKRSKAHDSRAPSPSHHQADALLYKSMLCSCFKRLLIYIKFIIYMLILYTYEIRYISTHVHYTIPLIRRGGILKFSLVRCFNFPFFCFSFIFVNLFIIIQLFVVSDRRESIVYHNLSMYFGD